RARVLEGQGHVDDRQAGLVREQPAHGDTLLARLAELGPIRNHRRLQVELAALHQDVRADRKSAFRGGGDIHDRVLLPLPVRLAFGETAPNVDNRAPAHIDAARCAEFAGAPFEVLAEGVADSPPPLLDVSLNVCLTRRAQIPDLRRRFAYLRTLS